MRKPSLILAALASFALSACGSADRVATLATGTATEICHDGVQYLQFSRGVSVKYLPSGEVAQCGGAASNKASIRNPNDDTSTVSMGNSDGRATSSGMSGSAGSSKSSTLRYSSGAGVATAE